MTVSMRRMSAGSGYRYLLRNVAAGDGNRSMSTPLTRYYSEAGTPPGRWMGSGLRVLGDGQLEAGMVVTEEQLALLIGMGRDPVTGKQLGRAYPRHVTGQGARHAVAGFDLTCSVPKSVSVLWGVADANTQERIVAAHHAAVADVLSYFEREVAATRTGVGVRGLDGRDGAVAQVEVAGVAAVAYDHYDSRAGDPQLHTHLVISNKVQTLLDGRWRSLDGRPVYASVTGLSGLYNALLADRLTQEIGVGWEQRDRGADRNPQWEIAGVSEELIQEFSSRSREIDLEKDRLIAAYVAAHGRRPSEKTIVELRAQATLATRPPKETRSLADLTAQWRRRARSRMPGDVAAWVASVLARPDSANRPPLSAEEVPLSVIEEIGASVVDQVSIKRSSWSHWVLLAEACRQTMGLRFASREDREAVLGMVVDAARDRSVGLTPPELATSPAEFRRPDGTSVFRPRHAVKYSSLAVLDTEARLLDRAEAMTGPHVAADVVRRAGRVRRGQKLSHHQLEAVERVATSRRQVDLLVGPAGAGKTTAMCALRRAWTAEHGRGSVVGLAPSAAAAQALADDLGTSCENTAKWLHEHDRGNMRLRPGQLVIVDEATLASTTVLDRITAIAVESGAKVLLVGDPHQLQSVDAGGAFALLVDRRPDAPKLVEVHRFTHAWEKDASLRLRRGEPEVIATYTRHQRILEGDTDQMLDAAYAAWRNDTAAGKSSILVTESAHAVRALNERARAERLLRVGADTIHGGREVELTGGVRASSGDVVVTRRNDRTLRTVSPRRGSWVKNGDRWRVTDVRGDGSVVVRRLDDHRHRRSGTAVLPDAYVREHLDLGYAVTAHRAQGITTDTAHVLVTASTTRENLYVSMTRGRHANLAYVALDQPDDTHSTPAPGDVTAQTVLHGVLRHTGRDLSAHQSIGIEHDTYASIAQLAAELETIAAAAQHDRFADLLSRSGLSAEQHQAVLDSPAFGPLTAALRRAEANHHDLERVLPRTVDQHRLDDADDITAVLRHRLEKTAARPPRDKRGAKPRLIAGLIPEPLGPMAGEHRQAIEERKELIETRARALAEQATQARAPWTSRLGSVPPSDSDRDKWLSAASTLAAYRDRYAITTDRPLGDRATSDAQRADRRRAISAIHQARAVGRSLEPASGRVAGHEEPTISLR